MESLIEFGLRDWLLILGSVFIVAVLLHGYWRMRSNRSTLKMALDKSFLNSRHEPKLDADELDPKIKQSTLYEDMETGQAIEVEPAYMAKAYREKIQNHIKNIEEAANGIRADHVLINTADPLDKALHNYLTFREKRG